MRQKHMPQRQKLLAAAGGSTKAPVPPPLPHLYPQTSGLCRRSRRGVNPFSSNNLRLREGSNASFPAPALAPAPASAARGLHRAASRP